MTEFEFEVSDRVTKIKSVNDLYDLEHNAFVSFSSGKRVNNDGYNQGGSNVRVVIEKWLNYRLTLN
jgi:hypothetical protein